jgi:hypothetical protein
MANIVIDVAAEFTGKKAFDQAAKSTFSLEKNVKKLAKAFGVAFAASTVVNYSRQAVKAFAADEASAVRLTRAVDNLGISFANPGIAKYIKNLESSAAIADDILRPAFQGLLTTTGSLTKSQELLNNAITISRASGIDLATVSQDLANGYVGITRGLKKYNTGLTKSELQTKSFAEILGVMLTRSAGAAQDYLGTTQYKMDSLGIATSNASEIIGGGLVNAFARMAGGTEASDAQKAIEGVAGAIAGITEATGAALGAIPNLLSMLKNLPKNIFMGFAGKQAGVTLVPKIVTPKPEITTKEQQAKLLAKLEADALKRQKALLALQKKQSDAAIKAAADKAKLAKASSIFDLDKIQIEAALKGKISDDEKLRLELQKAILNEDFTLAEKLQKQLETSQRATAALQGSINGIKPPVDPFAGMLLTLESVITALGKIAGMPGSSVGGKKNVPADSVEIIVPDLPKVPDTNNKKPPVDVVVIDPIPEPPATNNPFAGLGGSTGGFGWSVPQGMGGSLPQQPAPVTVIVNNNGTTIMENEFVDAVNKAVVIANTNGLNNNRPGAILTDG